MSSKFSRYELMSVEDMIVDLSFSMNPLDIKDRTIVANFLRKYIALDKFERTIMEARGEVLRTPQIKVDQ